MVLLMFFECLVFSLLLQELGELGVPIGHMPLRPALRELRDHLAKQKRKALGPACPRVNRDLLMACQEDKMLLSITKTVKCINKYIN